MTSHNRQPINILQTARHLLINTIKWMSTSDTCSCKTANQISKFLQQHVLKNIRKYLPDLFHITFLATDTKLFAILPWKSTWSLLNTKTVWDIVKEHRTYLNDDNKHENGDYLIQFQMKMGIGSFLLWHCVLQWSFVIRLPLKAPIRSLILLNGGVFSIHS